MTGHKKWDKHQVMKKCQLMDATQERANQLPGDNSIPKHFSMFRLTLDCVKSWKIAIQIFFSVFALNLKQSLSRGQIEVFPSPLSSLISRPDSITTVISWFE